MESALTIQLRNTGIHSRFVDGVVREDGFQLDEAVAPILAEAACVKTTDDVTCLQTHRAALLFLRDRLLARLDPATGLYSTLQDSEDEYSKQPFLTYDNVLTWRTLQDLAVLLERLKDPPKAREMAQRTESLRKAILQFCVSDQAPGSAGTVFVFPRTARAQFSRMFLPGP